MIDFGVAKATAGRLTNESMSTQFGSVIGTLEYMSPEQAGFSDEDIDTRADIYSLGVILYELLTGLRPIDARRLHNAALTEMIRLIREEEPSKPSTRLSTDDALPCLAALRQTDPRKLTTMLRGELDWVVMKCLEKHRDRRYETASSLARDVQRYLADEPVEARPPSAGYRLQKLVSRNKGQVIAASLVLLALLAGMAGTTWGLFQARRQEKIARDETFEKEKARKAEAARADGERLAKLDADQKRRDAERNLEYARKGNAILGSVFQNLDPNRNYATVAEYPMLSWVGVQLLDAYTKAGENAKLTNLILEMLTDARNTLPKDSPQLAQELAARSQALLQSQAFAEAEPLLRECLAIREKTQPDAWATFNTRSALGGALLGRKNFAGAEPLLIAGYEGMKQREKTIPATGQVRLTEALERLVQLYEATNKPDKAASWRKELEARKAAGKQRAKKP